MSILVRGAVGQQAGAGVLVRKGPRGMPAPLPPGGMYGGLPGEELPASPGTPTRPVLLTPLDYFLALLSALNVASNRYADNQRDQEKDKCKVYSYKDAPKECPDGRSHHIVPDRCWRSPGTRGPKTGKILFGPALDSLLDEYLPGRGGGYYYAEKMDEGKGQCICVSEDEHLAIHKIYDQSEKIIGEKAQPKWTATLDKLEGVGAESVSSITGCNLRKIKDTLRSRHEDLGLHKDTLLRADPFGQSGLTMQKFVEVLARNPQNKPLR